MVSMLCLVSDFRENCTCSERRLELQTGTEVECRSRGLGASLRQYDYSDGLVIKPYIAICDTQIQHPAVAVM